MEGKITKQSTLKQRKNHFELAGFRVIGVRVIGVKITVKYMRQIQGKLVLL